MKLKNIFILIFLAAANSACLATSPVKAKEAVTIVLRQINQPRIKFGAEQLSSALNRGSYVSQVVSITQARTGIVILVGTTADSLWFNKKIPSDTTHSKEGFIIRGRGKNWSITGADETGALYGCLELIKQLKQNVLPDTLYLRDQPEMVLRGTCVGLQKTDYLPGRDVYEYPYTPETFPWFYDKALWTRYLDSMLENRMNSLYLWNGHPFASLVRLKDYPYAVEVDDATFKKNEEMFRFLTTEADKRGIWVIQMFYNIIVSKPFAGKNGLKTQDRARPIIPIIADYTRKSIAAFVQKYPNVGLLVALGEAMEGDEMDVEWFTKTIIPGVKDGLKLLGKTDEPPIVLRGHDTDPERVMKAALPLYKNLYTEAKYNGEALTTYTPRGPWAEMHRALGNLGTVHIDNVHILANLEPFRYGAADFIRKSVEAMHSIHYANGLHLYPQASYWDWPYTADNVNPRLLQIDRDWIWYKEWGRYAWNCHRDPAKESVYWSSLLGEHFGGNEKCGEKILEAYEESGEISPKLLRRFGISNGNRQTLNLGMTMSQLINPTKWRVWPDLYTSDGPEGETLVQFAAVETSKGTHKGETPVQVMNEVMEHGRKAVAAIESAMALAHNRQEELGRIRNDMYCYQALANSFAEKAAAALLVLNYGSSASLRDLDSALPHLEKSVYWYQQLASLTKNTYLYANSMQTKQRKIPVGGDNGTNKTWVELLPVYQKELTVFKRKLDSLKNKSQQAIAIQPGATYKKGAITIVSGITERYNIEKGARPYSDTAAIIGDYAEPLRGLEGIRYSRNEQLNYGTHISFRNKEKVYMLIGYFSSTNNRFLHPPNLETDASANNYGQAEPKITNAMEIQGMPPVNIHTYAFEAGTQTFKLGKGICLILGFTAEPLQTLDAGIGKASGAPVLDWLFE